MVFLELVRLALDMQHCQKRINLLSILVMV